MTYCVYAHYKLGGEEPFYIGKGSERRSKSAQGRNIHWQRIVSKHGFEVKIIADDLTESDAFLLEKTLIAEYGRVNSKTGPLVNMTDGGEGVSGLERPDLTLRNLEGNSKETRRKISLNHADVSGSKNAMYGRRHTAESRKKISETKLAKPNRKPKSTETKQRMSLARKQWWDLKRAQNDS